MDVVVTSYYSGVSVTRLTRQYGINHWSVNKLVRERGPSAPPGQLRGRHGLAVGAL